MLDTQNIVLVIQTKKSFLRNQVELLDTNIVKVKMKSMIFITHSRIAGYSWKVNSKLYIRLRGLFRRHQEKVKWKYENKAKKYEG